MRNNAAERGEGKREEREVKKKKRKRIFNCRFGRFKGVSCREEAEGPRGRRESAEKTIQKKGAF
jgi:hypothetical protein